MFIHFHDIFLPLDYPPEWGERYYSEQYLLVCSLLAGNEKREILLANAFVSGDLELRAVIEEIRDHPSTKDVERHGCSFWLQNRASPRWATISLSSLPTSPPHDRLLEMTHGKRVPPVHAVPCPFRAGTIAWGHWQQGSSIPDPAAGRVEHVGI